MNIKRIIGGSLQSNGYIINAKNSFNCFVIDPGYHAKDFEKIMEKLGLSCKGILLTHNHPDHVGAVGKLALDTGASVFMHIADAEGYKGNVDVLLDGGELLSPDDNGGFYIVDHSSRSTESNLILEVIHTPGHSKGSVCFADFKDKSIFTGDTIFNVDLGRSDIGTGNEKELISSVRNIIDKWENDITVYPGHGDQATMKWVRGHNKEFTDIVKTGHR